MYPNDSIQLDDERFRQEWRLFVRSPAAQSVRQKLGTFWMTCMVWWFILLIAGLILLVTIRWSVNGLQLLHAVVTFATFKALKDNPWQQPELYQPLLAHGIIIAPDQKHALVLGTFESSSECSHTRNAEIARELAEHYARGDEDSDREMLALLRDDAYHPNRRRRVPATHNYGFKLLLLDVEIDLDECVNSPEETLLLALVARQGDSGPIAQIPWSIAVPAVRLTS